MSAPDGWERLSGYCIRRGDFYICCVSGKFELWRGREQLVVNLQSAQAAIEEWQKVSRESEAA
jgi:hypothetical protein